MVARFIKVLISYFYIKSNHSKEIFIDIFSLLITQKIKVNKVLSFLKYFSFYSICYDDNDIGNDDDD
jgi:hypothetical protein